MRKNKDGKIIASLTEVKNKTGDIFALVDEFGEVLLTSYNKPRYKIVKIGVSSMLDVESSPKSKVKKETKVVEKAEPKSEPVIEKKVVAAAPIASNIPAANKTDDLINKISHIQPWDRENKEEKAFVQNAVKGLIN